MVTYRRSCVHLSDLVLTVLGQIVVLVRTLWASSISVFANTGVLSQVTLLYCKDGPSYSVIAVMWASVALHVIPGAWFMKAMQYSSCLHTA